MPKLHIPHPRLPQLHLPPRHHRQRHPHLRLRQRYPDVPPPAVPERELLPLAPLAIVPQPTLRREGPRIGEYRGIRVGVQRAHADLRAGGNVIGAVAQCFVRRGAEEARGEAE